MNTSPDFYAYDIYAKLLFPLGHGHPLWIPEPGRDGEVLTGDVGFIDQGRFFRLFNIFHSAGDPRNKRGVPEHFQSLYLHPNQVVEAIAPVDRPITTLQNVGESTGEVFELECVEDQGAFLLMKDSPTTEKLLLSKSSIKAYMLPHCEEWAAFAHGGLKPDDIRLVSGWVKTDQWFMAAITQNGRSARLNLDASFTPRTILDIVGPRPTDVVYGYRVGPSRSDLQHDIDGLDDEPVPPRDQCVFVNYYKLKYRWFFIKDLEAAAEPKNLQPRRGQDDPGRVTVQNAEIGDVDISDTPRQVSTPCKPWDPVDFVLDYILLHSDAKVALAGTEDIITLCGSSIPDDIPAYLGRTRPCIEVDEDGVGSLSFEPSVHGRGLKAAQTADHMLADGSGIRITKTNVTSPLNSSIGLNDAQEACNRVRQGYVTHSPQNGACDERACEPVRFARVLETEAARAIPCA